MSIFAPDCLRGNTYLVTGASSGLGRDAAQLIARCGGRLLLCGRNQDHLAETLDSLGGRAPHQMFVKDMQDADQTADWLKEIASKSGPWNGIFHAAGTEFIGLARLTKQIHLQKVFSSLYAAFGIARIVSQKGIMCDGGSVVFMSSVVGLRGHVGMTAYSAAKAGMDGLVRSLACELAPRIRVNSIASGAVKTAMQERIIANIGPEAMSEYARRHAMGFGEPADISHAAVFLLSPAARWITGSTITVDGGYTAG